MCIRDSVKTMRAGVIVLGSLLSKFGKAKVSLPGGCAIGSRPVDIHLFGLKKLGADIKIKNGYILASAKKGLTGATIRFPSISVGATENVIIAASFAKGTTYLKNCACDPEIKNLTELTSKKIRVGGMVKEKSINVNQSEVNFVITDFKNELIVNYSGSVPNLFEEGKGVVAEGFLKDRNFLTAVKILAKHDENYMPPEVEEAIKESN